MNDLVKQEIFGPFELVKMSGIEFFPHITNWTLIWSKYVHNVLSCVHILYLDISVTERSLIFSKFVHIVTVMHPHTGRGTQKKNYK
jgi:hypothetical protein